jgi:hypothetical protein
MIVILERSLHCPHVININPINSDGSLVYDSDRLIALDGPGVYLEYDGYSGTEPSMDTRDGYLRYDCDSGTEFAQPQLGNIHSVDGDVSASRFNNPIQDGSHRTSIPHSLNSRVSYRVRTIN